MFAAILVSKLIDIGSLAAVFLVAHYLLQSGNGDFCK